MLKSLDNDTRRIGEKVLKSLEELIYRYPEEWYQWKNYARLEKVPMTGSMSEQQVSQSVLEPVFNNIS